MTYTKIRHALKTLVEFLVDSFVTEIVLISSLIKHLYFYGNCSNELKSSKVGFLLTLTVLIREIHVPGFDFTKV